MHTGSMISVREGSTTALALFHGIALNEMRNRPRFQLLIYSIPEVNKKQKYLTLIKLLLE